MAGREKGVETLPCPNCGDDRPVQILPDGARAAETCPKCYPAPSKKDTEKAAAEAPSRERGTDTKEA